MRRVAVWVMLFTLSSCASARGTVGRVVEVGPDPVSWLALSPPDGSAQLRLAGPEVSALRTVVGANVWVAGAAGPDGFRVERFEVRKVNNEPVDDGIVVVTADGVNIQTQSGETRAIPNAPSDLRALAGARIWISKPVSAVAPSYGVIARP